MKKRLLVLALISVLVIGLLSGCSQPAATEKSEPAAAEKSEASDKLVVYSPCSEDIINTIIPMFEKETGIKVELITAGTGELVKRIESEKENPYADVLFGGSRAQVEEYKDLFEPYVSSNDQYMMEGAKNVTGWLTAYCADGSCLLVNTDLIGDIKIEGYEDLLNPALKGKIAGADPASSSSAYYQLTNMLLAMGGDYTSDAGWDYVGKLLKNMEFKIASGSGAAHKSVADGEYVVALTYEDPSASYVKNGAPVKVVYPKEGAVFQNATAAIVKGGKNLENAKKFIDFIISKEAQDVFGTQLTNRPLRADAELGSHLTPMQDMKLIYEDEVACSQHKSEIVDKYIQLFTDLQE